MSEILALCPWHGPFKSFFNSIGTVQGLTLDGNIESCPTCGTPSKVMDGTFNVRDGLVEIIAAPSWTRSTAQGVAQTIQRASRGLNAATGEVELRDQIDDLARAIAGMNEDLGRLVQNQTRGKPKEWVKWFLGTLFTILLWVYSADDVGSFSKDVVAPIVDQVLRQNPQP